VVFADGRRLKLEKEEVRESCGREKEKSEKNVRWGEREKKIIFYKKLKVKIIILMI
jgi:hypothetical protein